VAHRHTVASDDDGASLILGQRGKAVTGVIVGDQRATASVPVFVAIIHMRERNSAAYSAAGLTRRTAILPAIITPCSVMMLIVAVIAIIVAVVFWEPSTTSGHMPPLPQRCIS